jgi:hypothetical protein
VRSDRIQFIGDFSRHERLLHRRGRPRRSVNRHHEQGEAQPEIGAPAPCDEKRKQHGDRHRHHQRESVDVHEALGHRDGSEGRHGAAHDGQIRGVEFIPVAPRKPQRRRDEGCADDEDRHWKPFDRPVGEKPPRRAKQASGPMRVEHRQKGQQQDGPPGSECQRPSAIFAGRETRDISAARHDHNAAHMNTRPSEFFSKSETIRNTRGERTTKRCRREAPDKRSPPPLRPDEAERHDGEGRKRLNRGIHDSLADSSAASSSQFLACSG